MAVEPGLLPLGVEPRLDVPQDRISLKLNDLGKEAQNKTQPGGFVHKGATPVAPNFLKHAERFT